MLHGIPQYLWESGGAKAVRQQVGIRLKMLDDQCSTFNQSGHGRCLLLKLILNHNMRDSDLMFDRCLTAARAFNLHSFDLDFDFTRRLYLKLQRLLSQHK